MSNDIPVRKEDIDRWGEETNTPPLRWNILIISAMASALVVTLALFTELPGEAIAGSAGIVLGMMSAVAKELINPDKDDNALIKGFKASAGKCSKCGG